MQLRRHRREHLTETLLLVRPSPETQMDSSSLPQLPPRTCKAAMAGDGHPMRSLANT